MENFYLDKNFHQFHELASALSLRLPPPPVFVFIFHPRKKGIGVRIGTGSEILHRGISFCTSTMDTQTAARFPP